MWMISLTSLALAAPEAGVGSGSEAPAMAAQGQAMPSPPSADTITLSLEVRDPEGHWQSLWMQAEGQRWELQGGQGSFHLQADVPRMPYLAIGIGQGEQEPLRTTVFLPSQGSAEVVVQRVGQELRLVTGPESAGQTMESQAGGAAGGVDRLAHVLWVGIALFAVALGYARSLIQARWQGEVAPVLGRLSRFLDREEGEGRVKD